MHARGPAVERAIPESLTQAYRELFDAEARLAEVLAQRRARIRHSVVHQWPILEEFLHAYGRLLSPAGLLVLTGRPDEGSALTGIPFTGPAQARELLSLRAEGDARSRAGESFWRCVETARTRNHDAPLESLFGSVLLAHAVPFTADQHTPETVEASIEHVARVLALARPQLVACVGAEALEVLGLASGSEALEDLARTDPATWVAHWPPGCRVVRYPTAEAAGVRFRVVPVPALDGAAGRQACDALTHLLAYAWA